MQAGEAKDKIVIITGAGRGIGRAIAERFGSEGSRVILADINKEAGENVADGIIADGGSATVVTTDVASEEQVDALFDYVLEKFSSLDVLVNNAGIISPTKHILEADKAWGDKLIGVNLTGTFMCARRAAHIMAVSSICRRAERPRPTELSSLTMHQRVALKR